MMQLVFNKDKTNTSDKKKKKIKREEEKRQYHIFTFIPLYQSLLTSWRNQNKNVNH